MKANPKLIILILVALAVGAIFVIPYLNNEPPGAGGPQPGQNEQTGQQSEAPDDTPAGTFSTTPYPGVKLKEALENKRPVFLEFYAVT